MGAGGDVGRRRLLDIRLARADGLDETMGAYEAARAFMRLHGNAARWPVGTPSRGVTRARSDFRKERIGYLRIDTHAGDLPMRGALERHGSSRRGAIRIAGGSPRIAYGCLAGSAEGR